ncbi:hypothetical protein QAD02_017635 [Eretmocerus hayati]|uniref:Uncharacterized protein n=1 Tax=Eretmocerus hayati TaxID=131215 RepID=A0ACC2PFK3_9HYME|nr:hypothetical protein QAD02_017635 [Eretmocerus hayati]
MEDEVYADTDSDTEGANSDGSAEQPGILQVYLIQNTFGDDNYLTICYWFFIANIAAVAVINNEGVDSEHSEDAHEDNASSSEISDFDLNLPTSHSYLGSNLEELKGRTILDEGIYMNLPLLPMRSVVLFPGQTLPLAVFGSGVINMLDNCIQKNRTFGVVCLSDDKLEMVGTTAEIFEYTQGGEDGGFCIKAKGRQRFKILEIIQGYSQKSANVRIMPEITLSHPIFEQRLTSLDHRRVMLLNQKDQATFDRIRKLDAAVTAWPDWVYKHYDPQILAFKIRQNLQFIVSRGSSVPTDPTDLSFWVAQNLPLDDKERILLLEYDCVISRLQWQLEYLTKDRILVCSTCDKKIAKQSDIFPMSKEGPQSTFCNSSGFIHDTITVYKAENLKLDPNPPSAEYSWFPGYAWTIANCDGCESHMGWRFTAHKNKSLRPLSFWGLTRKGLKSRKLKKSERKLSTRSDSS